MFPLLIVTFTSKKAILDKAQFIYMFSMHFNINYVKTNKNLVNIYLHYLTVVAYRFDMMYIMIFVDR